MPSYLPLIGMNSAEFMAAPQDFFEQVHASDGPGIWANTLDGGLVVTKHKFLKALAKHPALQAQDRSRRVLGPSERGNLQSLFDHHPVFMNEPEHMPIHRIAYSATASPDAKTIRRNVELLCDELLDDLLEDKQFDLVSGYCLPLASRVWAGMIGLNPDESVDLANCARSIGTMLRFEVSEDDRAKADRDAGRIRQMVDDAASRQSKLTAPHLTTVGGYRDIGHPDPQNEAVALLSAMTFDAIDGSAGMTANLFACLALNPDVLPRLESDKSTIQKAWIEATRWAPALLGLFRCPVEDVEVFGVEFESGVNIQMLNAAGNLDPEAFERPGEFDIKRRASLPLTFGGGGRACVGRLLAKIQGEVALERLLARTSRIEFSSDDIDWGSPGLLRSAQSLKVYVYSN